MADARIDQIADAIKLVLEADTTATYHADDILEIFDKNFHENLSGRHVYIMTDTFENPEAASRAKDKNDYSYIIVGVERYTENGKLPTKQWQRDRKAWFQDCVVDRVNEVRTFDEFLTMAGLDTMTYPIRANWIEVMDKELIISHKLFWSEMTLTLERME